MEPDIKNRDRLDWPAGTAKPNLFIVGFPRSGTTAMGSFLRSHPDVYMPIKRGMHYFGSDLPFPDLPERFDINLYAGHFRDAENEKIVCETSVWYVFSERAPQEFRKLCDTAKVIIMVRDPVETVYSLHSRLVWMGNENIFDFKKALEAETSRRSMLGNPLTPPLASPLLYRDVIKYADYLKIFLDVMGKENVHVMIYDDFAKDTAGEYKKALEFLGIDTGFAPAFQVMNPHRTVRSEYVHSLVADPPRPLKAVGRNRTMATVLDKLKLKKIIVKLNSKSPRRTPLDPDLEDRLREEFRPEVEKLGDLLGVDLSRWSKRKGR